MTLNHIHRVKVIGAGSIGNHLANAARSLGCSVVVCDTNPDALTRMREQIYPARYGQWDSGIELTTAADAPVGGFDLICIGTPPESHVPLALRALDESPRALQIEKPLCPPDMRGADELLRRSQDSSTKVFVGYDHIVGRGARLFEKLLLEGSVGRVLTFDVEFREFWGGIFQAHPWLDGPADSYLGFWQRGGGASGEHSHALNLWQHLALRLGCGRVQDVTAMVRYVTEGAAVYDDCCFWTLRTETGMVGRVVQDVVTQPVRKLAMAQGDRGTLQWTIGHRPGHDAVTLSRVGKDTEVTEIPKTRPEDFMHELIHIDESVAAGADESPMSLLRGMETMLVVSAAHSAQESGRNVRIHYPDQENLISLD